MRIEAPTNVSRISVQGQRFCFFFKHTCTRTREKQVDLGYKGLMVTFSVFAVSKQSLFLEISSISQIFILMYVHVVHVCQAVQRKSKAW